MLPIIPQKRCSCCKEPFPSTGEYFHQNKNSRDGLTSTCKVCAIAKSRLYYENNKERALAANIEWKKKHPIQFKAAQDAYVERNPDRVKRSKKQYYDTHSNYIYEQVKRRRVQSPEKYAAHKAVQIAVYKGELPKIATQVCELCGNQANHYHHWSYLPEHQLDVTPLCWNCHKKEHMK